MIFKSVQAYIDAVRRDPGLAMIPLGLVAEWKGISRSAVAEQIKSGALEATIVKGTRTTWRGVRPEGLFAQAERVETVARERRRLVLDALARLIEQGRTGTYGEVMEHAGMSPQNPRHRAGIGMLLSELSRESYARDGTLIAAIVVQKARGQPNALFFDLARELGALGPKADSDLFWRDQCAKVFARAAREVQPA